MRIAVVGAGRVGTALAVLLRRAGHDVAAVSGGAGTAERAARFLEGTPVVTDPADAARAGDVVLLAVPDDRIAEVASGVAAAGGFRAGQVVAHLSGATGLDVLDPARAAGASVLCLHPLQTFPSVEAALDRLAGSTFAVTAADDDTAAVGDRLARDVGGHPFRLAERDKPAYHAAAVFASNYLVAVLAQAEELFASVGVPDPLEAMAPLSRASVENALADGPAAALTGPVARGDAETVARNLRALAAWPERAEAYAALARVTLALAERAGLPKHAVTAVKEVLAAWR